MTTRLQLEISGPFEVSCEKATRGSSRRIEAGNVKEFWETGAGHYSTKQGCYIFALKAGRGYTPWYVGKTKRQSLRDECFGQFQLGKYNKALFNHRGKPVIFFVAPAGNKNVAPREVVVELEHYLIQQGYYENKGILNKANAKEPRWGIKGVLRSGRGKPDSTAGAFAKMMGI